MTRALPEWAFHPDLVAYYEHHRDSPADLYPSEKRFLPWLARNVRSILDVGCAAGGFRTIWRGLAPDASYHGVDLSPALVEAARRLHPDSEFQAGDIVDGLDLADRSADLVQALGWLHWVPEQKRALAELWRLTARFLFFDIRIVPERGAAGVGRQRIALMGEWDGRTETPYVTIAWRDLARILGELEPADIYAFGYWGHPADTAHHVPTDVCLATFVLSRRPTGDAPTVCLDLPLEWPHDLATRAQVLSGERLAEIVPAQ